MLNTIRGIVSGNKARYQEEGFDLDLVRITDRMIIMGYPAAGLASLYRNKRSDVLRFLEPYAPHYRIFNLCPLYENSYDANDIVHDGIERDSANHAVARFPWPDHHPPPLSMFRIMVSGAKEWYDADDRNVIVIHCKAGKGRSGTFAISILMALSGLPRAPSSTSHHTLARQDAEGGGDDDDDDDAGGRGQFERTGEAEDSSDPTTTSDLDIAVNASNSNERNGTLDLDLDLDAKLEWLLKFHTERRMKPGVKNLGVSISSQRRFLGYWSRLLRGDDPRTVPAARSNENQNQNDDKRWIVLEYVKVRGPGVKGPKARFAGVGNDKIAVQVWRYKDSIAENLRRRELDLVAQEEVGDNEADARQQGREARDGPRGFEWDDREKMFVRVGGFVERDPTASSPPSSSSSMTTTTTHDPSRSSSKSTLELPQDLSDEHALEEYASTADTVSPFPSRSPSPRLDRPNPPPTTTSRTDEHEKLLVPHTSYLPTVEATANDEQRSSGLGGGTEADARSRVERDGGIVVDAEREVMLKFLVGETGKKHGKLPTMAALAITWFIPAFEVEQGGRRRRESGATTTKTTSRIRFGAKDLDFVKKFAGIEEVEVGWRWL